MVETNQTPVNTYKHRNWFHEKSRNSLRKPWLANLKSFPSAVNILVGRFRGPNMSQMILGFQHQKIVHRFLEGMGRVEQKRSSQTVHQIQTFNPSHQDEPASADLVLEGRLNHVEFVEFM